MDPPPGPPDKPRVLVVEDNRAVADMFARVLRAWGYEPLVAYDGASALEAARAVRPPAILLDINLPDISGYEVARRIRREPGLDKVLLVTMSGDAPAAGAGVDLHLMKPFPPEALRQALTSVRPPHAASPRPS
jgi:two-component system, chemotaxis family, CheB/CheR fusion protein